jgi:DNA-directed RNA polymerase specialized sigma24 family protein
VKTEVQEEEIKLGLRGDEQKQLEAICKAYGRYRDPLASYAREQFPALDSQEVATAVNDVFLELARKAKEGKFRTDGSLKSLLFQMVWRNATDQWRARCRWYKRKISEFSKQQHDGSSATEELTDDEVASLVAQKLSNAPAIATAWKVVTQEWTAANQVAAIEIVRQFKVWIASALSPLQRKVAELMAISFGEMTDEEMCRELAKTEKAAPLGSVKSARREIREKFTSLIKQLERTKT